MVGKLCCDRQGFYSHYIVGGDKKTYETLERGSAIHRGIECFLKGDDYQGSVLAMGQFLQAAADGGAVFEDISKTLEEACQAFHFWFQERANKNSFLPEEVEYDFYTKPDWLHLPIKGKMDVCNLRDGIIIDHKAVSSKFNGKTAAYEIQAGIYMHAYEVFTGQKAKQVIFDEIKISKNRDGGPQVTEVVVYPSVEIMMAVKTLLSDVVDDLHGKQTFLPNYRCPMAGQESWEQYKARSWTRFMEKQQPNSF